MAFGAKIKLSVDNSNAAAFRNEIQNYVARATSGSNAIKVGIKIDKDDIIVPKSIAADIKRQINSAGGIGITVKLEKVDSAQAIKTLRNDIQTMLRGLNIAGLKEFLGTEGVDATVQAINNAKQSIQETKGYLADLQSVAQTYKRTYESALGGKSKIQDQNDLEAIRQKYIGFNQELERIKQNSGAVSAEEIKNLADVGAAQQRQIELLQEKQRLQRQVSDEAIAGAEAEAKANEKRESQMSSLNKRLEAMYAKINRYATINTKAYAQKGGSFQQLYTDLNEIDALIKNGDFEKASSKLNDVQTDFTKLGDSVRLAGLEGKSFFEILQAGWAKFGGWSIITKTMTTTWRLMKDMVSTVRELDTAMTELRKVTDLTAAGYERYMVNAAAVAQNVGANLSDTINATADFARLGYNIEEATQLAQSALVYFNVGDGINSIDEATEALISTMRAFKIEAADSISIVDKYNKVGNEFPVSAQGIGTALQKSAAAMASANNTLEQTIGLATAMNSVVQNPQIVGTSLKTVSMYLRSAKVELEEAGESTEGMAESVSKLRDTILGLTKGAVDIQIDENTFKSTYEILKEIAQVWDTISDIDQAALLEKIGGKRNANTVAALLSNFDLAEDAMTAAMNAAGSAMAENEKYLDSINGRLSLISAKWQSLSQSILGSDIVKTVLGIADGLLSVATALEKINLLLPAITALGIVGANGLSLRKTSPMATEIMQTYNAMTKQLTITDTMAAKLGGLTAHEQALVSMQLQRRIATGEVTAEMAKQIVTDAGLTAAEGTLVMTTHSLSGAFTTLVGAIKGIGAAFATAFASNPIGMIIELTAVAITAVRWFKEWYKTTDELVEEYTSNLSELSDKTKSISDSFKSLKESSDDIAPRFAELAQHVDEFGNNIDLTEDEYKEYIRLNNQLAELFPELNTGFDEEGNAMLALSGNAEELTGKIDELVEAQRRLANEKIAATLPEVFDNVKKLTEVYEDQIEDYDIQIKQIKEMRDEAANSSQVLDSYSIALQNIFGDRWVSVIEKYTNPDTTVDWAALINGPELDDQLAAIERKVEDSKDRMAGIYKQLNPVIGSWMQTDFKYQELDDDYKNIARQVVSSLNFSELGLKTENEVKSFITDNVIDPFYEAGPELKQAFSYLFDGSLQSELKKANDEINALFASYGKGNVDYNLRPYINNGDGSYSTMRTEGYQLLEGDQAISVTVTPILEDGTELDLDKYIGDLEAELYRRMEAGEKVDIDTLLSLDSAKAIVVAMAGEWDKNSEAMRRFEEQLQPLKDKALELYKLLNGGMLDALRDLGVDDSVLDILDDLVDKLIDVEDAAKDAGSALNKAFKRFSVSDALDAVETIDKVAKSLSDLMLGMQDSGTDKGLDVSGLKSIAETFKGTAIEDQLDGWITKLSQANGSMTQTNAIIKDMINSWITQEQYLDQSGEALEILTRALEEAGFSFSTLSEDQKAFLDNQWEIIQAHQAQAESAEDAAQAIQADIDALIQEAVELGIAQNEWINYYLSKYSGSGSISTSGDIAALAALIGYLDAAQASWIDFYKARADQLKAAQTHAARTVSTGGIASDYNNSEMKGAAVASNNNQALLWMQQNKGKNPLAIQNQTNNKLNSLGNNRYTYNAAGELVPSKYGGFDKSGNVIAEGLSDYIDAGIKAGDDYAKLRLEEETQRLLGMSATGGDYGAGFDPNVIKNRDSGSGSSKGKGGGSDGSSKSDKKKEEEFDKNRIDWIQRRIDMLQKMHDQENDIASDEAKSFTERIASMETMRAYDRDLIEIYQAQADAYKESYEEIFGKLQSLIETNGALRDLLGGEVYDIETLKKAIEEGVIDLSKFSEEEYKLINDAIGEYDTYMTALDKVRDKEREEHEEFMREYELRIKEIETYLSVIQSQATNIENELELIEARGEVVTESAYRNLIRNAEEQIGLYEDQISTYEEMLDELDEGSAEYNETLAHIQDCANAIQECELKQIEWNEAIKDIPIRRIEKYLATLRDIKTDITNFISEQETLGKTIDAGAYQELISMSDKEIKKLIDQQKLLKDKLKDYDFGSEKYKETADEIQGIDDSISEVLQSMSEWNRAILELPINKLNKVTDELNLMKDALDDVLDDYDSVIDGVIYLIDKETKEIEKQRDAYEKMMDERIQAIQDVIDALEQENEAREKTLAVEQAEYDLNRAETQKSIAVIQDGQKQFIADQNAIREAQNALNEATFEKRIWELEQEIDALEKEKDAMLKDYDAQLEFLDAQAEKWKEITSSIQGTRDMLMSLQYLGSGWDTKVLNGTDNAIYNSFYNNYKNTSDQSYAYERQIESNERIAELMQAYVDGFLSGAITYEKALDGVKSLTANINKGLAALTNVDETRKLLGGGSVTSILNTLESDARAEADRYPEYFGNVKSNISTAEAYTKSWEELKKQVKEEQELLEKQWKELQETKEAQKKIASTVRHSDHDGGNAITTTGTYRIVSGGYETKVENGVAGDPVRIKGSSLSELADKGYSASTIIADRDTFGRYSVNTYHSGIANGAVGKLSNDDKAKALQALALTPIESDEVPALLKAGEVVLNSAQQSNLLANMGKIAPMGSGTAVNVSMEMSNLTFNEIQDGQDFANFITKNLSSAVAQGLSQAV